MSAAAGQPNPRANRRAFSAIRRFRSGCNKSSTIRSAKSVGVSAKTILSPSTTGRPSAPSRVETVVSPIAIVSKILMRVPAPWRSGRTINDARRTPKQGLDIVLEKDDRHSPPAAELQQVDHRGKIVTDDQVD